METKEKKHRWTQGIKSKVFWIGIAAFVGIMTVIVLMTKDLSNEGKVTTISEASLEKVIETSQLSTMEYTFNGVTRVTKEFFDTTKYYVAYEGTVRAGIDFSAIDI